MGPNYSILLRDIHLGMPTSKVWRPMVHGVITWFSMVRQTALIPAFTWSAVIIMMYWLTHNVKMSTVTGLYWDTYVSFTMLALFHANHLKVIHLLPCNVRFKKTLKQIEVVVLKWQYVMSNFCRLSEAFVLVIYLVTTCAEGTYLHSVPSPFVKTYDFIFVNKPKNRTEVNLSSKLQNLVFPLSHFVFFLKPFKKLAVLYYQV